MIYLNQIVFISSNVVVVQLCSLELQYSAALLNFNDAGLTTPAASHPLTGTSDTSQATGSSTQNAANGSLPPLSSALAQIMQETLPASSSGATLHKCATAPAAISK